MLTSMKCNFSCQAATLHRRIQHNLLLKVQFISCMCFLAALCLLDWWAFVVSIQQFISGPFTCKDPVYSAKLYLGFFFKKTTAGSIYVFFREYMRCQPPKHLLIFCSNAWNQLLRSTKTQRSAGWTYDLSLWRYDLLVYRFFLALRFNCCTAAAS